MLAFVWVYWSYAVNIHQVEHPFATAEVAGGERVPVSKAYLDDLLRMLRIG